MTATLEHCTDTLHPGRPGSAALYRRGCRCLECRDAKRDQRAERDERARQGFPPRIPGIPPGYIPIDQALRDHLQLLLDAGWTRQNIALETGNTAATIANMHRQKYIHGDRAARILGLRPADTPSQDFIDWVVVERLVKGQMHWRDATMAERRDAARRMFAAGRSWNEVTPVTGLRSATLAEIKASIAA